MRTQERFMKGPGKVFAGFLVEMRVHAQVTTNLLVLKSRKRTTVQILWLN